ncbi:hypothetical protein [Soonwooa purpurea]
MKKLLGLITAAMSMLGCSAVSNTAKSSVTELSSSINDLKATSTKLNSGSLFKINNYRPFASEFNGKTSIDPKTYGMYFVKRGTHKRTNI